MGSATAGLLFVIVVVVIAIVCFRYWPCREQGCRAGFGGCSRLQAELQQLQSRSEGLDVLHGGPAGGPCVPASQHQLWALPGLLLPSLSTAGLSSPTAPQAEVALLAGCRRGSSLWLRLPVLGFGSWQHVSLPHQERDGY